MYLFNNFNLQKEQQLKKLVSLAMLVLLLGGSAATVIPNSTAQPATVAQPVQLSDEQLDGVKGGSETICFCTDVVFGYFRIVHCIDGSVDLTQILLGGCDS